MKWCCGRFYDSVKLNSFPPKFVMNHWIQIQNLDGNSWYFMLVLSWWLLNHIMAVVADSLASFNMACHLQAPWWPSLFLYAYLTGVHDFPDIAHKIISPVWIMMAWSVFRLQCTATTVVNHAIPMGVSRILSEQGITHLSPVPQWIHSHENSFLGPYLSAILIILCINFFVFSLIHDTN